MCDCGLEKNTLLAALMIISVLVFSKTLGVKMVCQKAFLRVTLTTSTCHSPFDQTPHPHTQPSPPHPCSGWRRSQTCQRGWHRVLTLHCGSFRWRCRHDFLNWACSMSSYPAAWDDRSEFWSAQLLHFAPRVASDMSYHEPSAALYL